MARDNGGIIGPANNPTSDSASGVWDLPAQYQAISGGNWPPIPSIAANSLRFDDGSTDYLSRTPASASNRKTWTWSAWVKRASTGNNDVLFSAGADSSNYFNLYFTTADVIAMVGITGGVTDTIYYFTNRVFRDPSAWYHIVFQYDSTNATESDRFKLYINGVRETSFQNTGYNKYPTLNYDEQVNSTNAHRIGEVAYATGNTFDGYMSEVILVDGQALEPTSFGQFNANGIWTPIPIGISSYGTNGFRLKFENSASLGLDSSPNGNNWTVNNLTSIDQVTDTPTNNFCTMNPLDTSGTVTFSNGNNTTAIPLDNNLTKSTLAVSQGKWYVEIKYDSTSDNSVALGIINSGTSLTSIATNGLFNTGYTGVAYFGFNGNKYVNGSSSAYGNSFTTGDIIGIALDLDNNYVYFSKNGTWQNSGDPTSGASGTGGISISNDSYHTTLDNGNPFNAQTVSWNFGNPTFTISSGNSDANGYGNFEYAVPSGYYALNTKNLAEFG